MSIKSNITRICDNNSLFAHIRELAQAAELGLRLRIIVIKDSGVATNCVDTTTALEGLGLTTGWETDLLFAYPG